MSQKIQTMIVGESPHKRIVFSRDGKTFEKSVSEIAVYCMEMGPRIIDLLILGMCDALEVHSTEAKEAIDLLFEHGTAQTELKRPFYWSGGYYE